MIRKDLASRFIERLVDHLDYNINIMDKNGIIIASRDKKRINTFHEAAYRIINQNEEIEKIYPDAPMPSGVKPGVNLPIVYNNKTIGVVGITGNPEEILSVTYAVKTSVESMIEYELYKESILIRQNKKNALINLILYEKNLDLNSIEKFAEKLGYNTKLYRTPIIIKKGNDINLEDFLTVLKSNHLHSKQDISSITIDRNILLFKVLDLKDKYILYEYKEQVKEYIKNIKNTLTKHDQNYTFKSYVGNYKKNMLDYRYAFEQVQWCQNFIPDPDEDIIFFYDYVEDYFLSKVPMFDFVQIYSNILDLLKTKKNESLLETMRAIFISNMNLQKASFILGVHRNTVYQRLKKIKEILGVDPYENISNRKFFYFFIRYMLTNDH